MKNRKYLFAQRGVMTMEFALFYPLLLLTVLFVLEAIRVQVAVTYLERSFYQIAYQLRLAQGRDLDGITAQVLGKAPPILFVPADIKMRASNAVSVGALTHGLAGTGKPGDLVLLELSAQFGILLPFFGEAFGYHPLHLSTVTMNEPTN